MNAKLGSKEQDNSAIKNWSDERGSAIVVALFILGLMSVFVAITLTQTSAEAAAVGNETSETRTFYAAQGSLEMMTRNFNKIFDGGRQNISAADLAVVEAAGVPTLDARYAFDQHILPIPSGNPKGDTVVMTGGPYSGLYALRDTWRLQTEAQDRNDQSRVFLTRNILRNKIPIFQFGVFYEDDLELFNGPRFGFGGRVHTNRHFFLSPSSNGAYFDSRVTAAGHIATQIKKNGDPVNSTTAKIYIKNASGVFKQLAPDKGSVLSGTPNVFGSGRWYDPELPPSYVNTGFVASSAQFDGNLQALVPSLRLPMQLASTTSDLVELIRRGKNAPTGSTGGDLVSNGYRTAPVPAVTTPSLPTSQDNPTTRSERYANKTGIRVSLSDSKAKLPGCATTSGTAVTGPCGVQLDVGSGYTPRPMSDGYTATALNAYRFDKRTGQELWIKVETVSRLTDGTIVTEDVTEDILSLGITEQIPDTFTNVVYDPASPKVYNTTHPNVDASSPGNPINQTAAIPDTLAAQDSRSVIKLQRFAIPGAAITKVDPSNTWTTNLLGWNVVARKKGSLLALAGGCASGCPDEAAFPLSGGNTEIEHWKAATIGADSYALVPFPIQMLDSREGLYYDSKSTTYYANANFDNFKKFPVNGAMSLIDIDVANLRRFLRGDFDGLLPSGTTFESAAGHTLKSTDIPQDGGWVFYVSDRRGDIDFDGELDMEDVYGTSAAKGNDDVMKTNEDVNRDGLLEANYVSDPFYGIWGETERYKDNAIYRDKAAVVDHPFYRRGVRLINGTVLPGYYDATDPLQTRGFTVASENGVYVLGNYNATRMLSISGSGNTAYDQYAPFNTSTHIPASIVGDAVMILSNAWNDAKSFNDAWNLGSRDATPTVTRFAMISGDTITGNRDALPSQGTGDANNNGGLHNFKRFLEDWSGIRLNYAGSLINLYNSHNNNGTFKCCNVVYGAPTRDWVFDSTFLDPTRLPPGTPAFQYIQTTGFERANN